MRHALAWSAYPLLRPLLFSLEPERAHDLSLKGLDWAHRWLGPLMPPAAPIASAAPIELAGLRFPNRVGLAAGLDKNAAHLDGLARFGFGFMEVGTVTPKPQPGNPQPRLFRLPKAEGLINRFGFNNLGLETFLANVAKSKWVKERRGILGLNIGKNASTPIDQAADDYSLCLEAVYPWADYITINISSPNTKNLRDLQSEEALRGLLGRLRREANACKARHGRRVPLFLKIAPDLDNDGLEQIAKTARDLEMEGLIATNTTLDRALVSHLPNGLEPGGLSGRPLTERAQAVMGQLRALVGPDMVLIGVGGIFEPSDALARRAAGADLIQVYSGLIYRGPQLVEELDRALSV